MHDFWRTGSILKMHSKFTSGVSRSSHGLMLVTSGLHTCRSLWSDMAGESWNGPGTSSSRQWRRCHRSLRGGCTCSMPNLKRSTVWRGMLCPSTTGRQKQWRRRTCSRCMAFCCERRLSCLVRLARGRSMIKPSRPCRRIVSRMPACAMLRWKPCLVRWTERAPFMCMRPNSAIRDGKKSSGKFGAVSKSNMEMKTRSVTCSESSAVFKRCSLRFISMLPTLRPKQGVKSSIQWQQPRRR
mmetsp:Transcript_23510/g.55804  ORF Transcript_23510/g.55804 Transcript_23510/m.55804 type:complete len:240 (+) Transcript_23510:1649-2368(+)